MKDTAQEDPGNSEDSLGNMAGDVRKGKAESALSSIVFVQSNSLLLEKLGIDGLDTSIPLPVQLSGPIKRFDPSLITTESILTGILRVLAWKPHIAHAVDYRNLLRSLRPGLLEELSTAGVQKVHSRDWDIAEEIFLALAGVYPERAEPLLDLALLYEEHARIYLEESKEPESEAEDDRAFACYKKLIGLEPAFVPAYYHAALFYLRKKNFERAVSLLKSFTGLSEDKEKVARAKEIISKLEDMGYLDTLFKEAYDFMKMGDAQRGLEKATQFVERYPNVWNGWFLLGWACRKLMKWEEGKKAFTKAIQLGADEVDTFNELSICQMETGDYSGAQKSLERALRLEPENIKIICNLGALAYKTDRKTEAEGFFRTALEIDIDDTLSRDWLKRIESEKTA
jgi:tetratricopeptide (TPR) repeat protein